jgi:phytoene synthase
MARPKPIHRQIFQKGSKTYFNSSLFFPKEVRENVFIFYAWVRVADNFVDDVPQDEKGFRNFCDQTYAALEGRPSGDDVIDTFVELYHEKGFEKSWVDAFLHSMGLDLVKSQYDTLEETLEYIYGSAEVIGLFMCAIMGLPEESYHHACMMGRNMQYINFIRDIDEDIGLGRRYLPLKNTKLKTLDKKTAYEQPQDFLKFMQEQTQYYKGWQKEAEKGYHLIPKRYLIPIKTASDMYNWTAAQIEKNPYIVFERQVKPSKGRIIWTIIKNLFYWPRKS